jgi:hypothetical protein
MEFSEGNEADSNWLENDYNAGEEEKMVLNPVSVRERIDVSSKISFQLCVM